MRYTARNEKRKSRKSIGILTPLFLFLIFAGLQIGRDHLNPTTNNNNSIDTIIASSKKQKSQKYVSSYTIQTEYDQADQILNVSQNIVWRNLGDHSTKEIYFHLYPNAYKSSRTIFANGREIPIESQTAMIIDSFSVNSVNANLIYVNTDVRNQYDSTTAKIDLEKEVKTGDSVLIEAKYHFKVPRAYGRFGRNAHNDFVFFAQWFIKTGVFENGRWICSPFFQNAEFYSDFSEFTVELRAPEQFKLSATGNLITTKNSKGTIINIYRAKDVHDFAWCAAKDYIYDEYQAQQSDGSDLNISIVAPEAYTEYIPRYKAALQNALDYMGNTIGVYPYPRFTMVIAPTRSGNIASMEYPTMIVINHDRISSLFSYLPEELVIHEFIHQYFYGIIANNESYEGWLDEGLTSYLTTGVLEKSHSADVSRFHLFGGLNVRGMKLLSMDEVPLIYSLANIKIPFSVNAPMSYYQSLTAANLRDSSYLLPPPIYQNITYGKGELFFKGLEGALGQEKLFSILKSFFNDNKYKHVNATQLFAMIRKTTGASLDWYFSDYYHNAPVCDYRIAGIEHTLGSDRYDVIVRRERTAYWPSDIALYTDRDTLYARCLDSLRTIKITFYTNAEVFGAEIDPYRKNCYDIDIANNSYMIEKQYSAITYFSIRWFYWIQNFLMVFGTLG